MSKNTTGCEDGAGSSVMVRAFKIFGILAVSSLFLACGTRSITRDALRSELISAISIAGETEMSIDFVLHRQATGDFAAAQFRYLANQLHDSAKDLDGATPAPGLEANMRNGDAQIDALSSALNTVLTEADDPAALSATKERVETIRKALEQAKSRL